MLEEQLNELNIFALRNLARSKGVVSPTSKKKDELINDIIEIMSGKKKPEISKTKQGRPPKSLGFDFTNIFSNQDLSLTLNQETPQYENQDIKTVAGWVELGNNSALLWVQNKYNYEHYFIPGFVLNKYNLKMGDRVVVEILFDESQKVVKDVFSINGCPILKFSKVRKDYYEIEHNLPSKTLKFNSEYDINFKVGENVYFYGTNNNDNTSLVIDLMNNCEIENKIYINVSVAEKNKVFLNKIANAEKFIASIQDDADFARRIVTLAIERAKRILESGEEVLIVVDDVLSVKGIDKENLNLTKGVVSLTKNANKNGSITTFAVLPNESISQVEKLADVRIKVSEKNMIKIN